MGVQTLHAGAGATHAAVRSRSDVIRRQRGVALGRISSVRICDEYRIDFGFGSPNGAGCFESADSKNLAFADQPVASRHRLAAVEQGSVADDDRSAFSVADDDLESAARGSTDQLANSSDVVAHDVSYGGVDAQ